MDPAEFVRLLKAKKRTLEFTLHGSYRLNTRLITKGLAEQDLLDNVPAVVAEEGSSSPSERRFRVYYRQIGDLYHTYIVAINSKITLITAWRTNKGRQNSLARGKLGKKL